MNVPSDGLIPWDGSTLSAISVVNRSNTPLGFKALLITEQVTTPAPAALQATAHLNQAEADATKVLSGWDDGWASFGPSVDRLATLTPEQIHAWEASLPPVAGTAGTPSLADLASRLAAIDAEAAAIEAQRPTVTVTPSLTVTALQSDTTTLRVHATGMPAGVSVWFGSVVVPLPAGTGDVTIPLRSFTHGDRRLYAVQLVREDGSVAAADLGQFGVAGGNHTYAGYGYDPHADTPAISALQHTVPGSLSAAAVARLATLQAERSDVQAAIDTQAASAAQSLTTLAQAVDQAVAAEAARVVILPALYLDNLRRDNTGFRVTVHFSNPADTTYIHITGGVGDASVSHPCGTSDGSVDLGQNDLQNSGIKRVELWDRPGGTLLQTAYIAWDYDTRQASILTAQPASWDAVRRTMTEAELAQQLTPGIAADIQGRTVFVSYVSGSDQAVVQITRTDSGLGLDPVGLAAKEVLSNPGGTTQGATQLAIPADLRPGPLTLQLFDRPYGTVVASISLQWDGTTLTVTGGAVQAATAAQQHALLASATALRPDIARIERLNLFYATPYAIDGGDQFMQLLIKAFPDVFPADQEAEITRRWQAGPTYSRGWYQDELIKAQQMRIAEYTTHLHNYETAMSDLVMQSVQFWVDLKNGAAQQPETDRLRASYDATNIDGMRPLGVLKPSLESITNEGHRLFTEQYGYMLRVQDDNAQARLADALHAQQAEVREAVVAQQARALDRILTRTAAADPSAADAINRLKAADPQLTGHWAEELVGTDGPRLVDDQTLTALLTTQLDMTFTDAWWSILGVGDVKIHAAGDVLSAMTPETLTRILHDANAGLQSALASNDQVLIDHFTRLKAAAEGLLSDRNNANSPEWIAYIEQTTTDPALDATESAAQLSRDLDDLWALHRDLMQVRQELIQQFSGIHSDIERGKDAVEISSLLFNTWHRLGDLQGGRTTGPRFPVAP